MSRQVMELAVQIVRFVDASFPGFVECEFADAVGKRHTIGDKVPVLSLEDLDADSAYPRRGAVSCVILNRWFGDSGRELVTISTAEPLAIESTEGLEQFVVLSTQLSVVPNHR